MIRENLVICNFSSCVSPMINWKRKNVTLIEQMSSLLHYTLVEQINFINICLIIINRQELISAKFNKRLLAGSTSVKNHWNFSGVFLQCSTVCTLNWFRYVWKAKISFGMQQITLNILILKYTSSMAGVQFEGRRAAPSPFPFLLYLFYGPTCRQEILRSVRLSVQYSTL